MAEHTLQVPATAAYWSDMAPNSLSACTMGVPTSSPQKSSICKQPTPYFKHLSLLVVASLAHGRLTTKGFYSALSTHDYLLVRSCCTMLFNHHRNRHRCSFATLDYDAIPMVTLNPIADRTLILRLLLTYRIGIDDVGVNVGSTSPLYGKLDSSQSVHNRTDGRKDFMNATAKLSNKTY